MGSQKQIADDTHDRRDYLRLEVESGDVDLAVTTFAFLGNLREDRNQVVPSE